MGGGGGTGILGLQIESAGVSSKRFNLRTGT